MRRLINMLTQRGPDRESRSGVLTDSPVDEQRYMLVGLGNPGRKYESNRHNVGFIMVDRLATVHGIDLTRRQHKALIGTGRVCGRSVILVKPQTFMNRSGESVGRLARYYKIPVANLLVIYDELDIPFGTIRIREKGGAGGHNGMRSVIQHLGEAFPRLRLGVGRPAGKMPPAAFVLQDFHQDELPILDEMIGAALKAIETFLTEGVGMAMSRHNGAVNAA